MLVTREEFITYFTNFGLNDLCLRVLEEIYHAPNQTLNAEEVAKRLGYSHVAPINSQIGRKGNEIAQYFGKTDSLEYQRDEGGQNGWRVFFTGEQRKYFIWLMRPEVAEALETVYGFNLSNIAEEDFLSGQAIEEKRYIEGRLVKVRVNRYERNPKARHDCLAHYGYRCVVCGLSLQELYGEVAKDIIHVHHLKPISEMETQYQVNPIEDLRPVCPNCHAVIHSQNPPYSIEAVQKMLTKQHPPNS